MLEDRLRRLCRLIRRVAVLLEDLFHHDAEFVANALLAHAFITAVTRDCGECSGDQAVRMDCETEFYPMRAGAETMAAGLSAYSDCAIPTAPVTWKGRSRRVLGRRL